MGMRTIFTMSIIIVRVVHVNDYLLRRFYMKYVQMKLSEFYRSDPVSCSKLFGGMLHAFLSDPLYVVRISRDGRIEVGYEGDDWFIK